VAENRKSVHELAEASGMTYQQVKFILFNIMSNTPVAVYEARRLIDGIRGGINR
jgi:hypothetical protein